MNKKLLGIVSALALTAVAGVSCAKSTETYVYFGLGNFTKASQKSPATGGKTVQSDVYAGVVLFDQDGKVLDANIDVMQATVKSTALNTIETAKAVAQMNTAGDFKSKWDLGDAYGMKTVSTANGIGKEWYEQMNAYENWVVGKTLTDVRNAGYKVKDASHVFVPTNAALIASVSITTEGYFEVLERAWNNRVAVKVAKPADVRIGLGMYSSITSTSSKQEVVVTVAGGLFGKDEKVLAGRHDVHQVPLTTALRADTTDIFDVSIKTAGVKQLVAGATADKATVLSKHDLGPAYAMYYKAVDTATTNQATKFFNGKIYEVAQPTRAGEWYEQANSIVGYLVGKKVADVVAGMNTETSKFNAGVLASVTITVDEYLLAYVEAFDVSKSATR